MVRGPSLFLSSGNTRSPSRRAAGHPSFAGSTLAERVRQLADATFSASSPSCPASCTSASSRSILCWPKMQRYHLRGARGRRDKPRRFCSLCFGGNICSGLSFRRRPRRVLSSAHRSAPFSRYRAGRANESIYICSHPRSRLQGPVLQEAGEPLD